MLIYQSLDPDKKPPDDPLAALEKTTDAQKVMDTVHVPRLEALQQVSDQYTSDPYTLSKLVRKKFRHDKKVELEKREKREAIKGQYGLSETLKLLEDDEADVRTAKQQWEAGRRELLSKHPHKARSSTSSGSSAASTLKSRLLLNTANKSFLNKNKS